MSHECIWNRPTRGASHSDATEAAVSHHVSVSSRSGLRQDLWKTSPLLSAHLGFHVRYNAAEGPGLPALQSTRTTLKPCQEEKKRTMLTGATSWATTVVTTTVKSAHLQQTVKTATFQGHVLKSNSASVVSIHLQKNAQHAQTWRVTWMRASGFSRLRIRAACCCFSSSTMEAKVTVEYRGGLPTGPSTQGLMWTDITEGQQNTHSQSRCYKESV